MKVLLLNGSPHEKGCTYTALAEIAKTLESEGVEAEMMPIETTTGATTSDRVELRCVLGLRAVRRETTRAQIVTQIGQKPAPRQEHGFVLVWPADGESRWETARRLRVAEDCLRPAGKRALLVLKK